MEPKNRKKGFAMLEVMIIIMVFMVLAASLFASAGAINRRAVSRAANNEAYYAALAAVKLMAGEVMNNEHGPAAVALTGSPGLSESETSISITTEDGETRNVPVKISSKTVGSSYLMLTAKATVNGQTENVSMTLQKRNALVPDYPYGCGLMGKLSVKGAGSVSTGPDTDIYLQGYEKVEIAQESAEGGIKEVGGNLVIDGSLSKDGIKLQLKDAKIGGMIISNDDVALEHCVVGNKDSSNIGISGIGTETVKTVNRKGGIYTTGALSLTNCDIYGDIYAETFSASGKEDVWGWINYKKWERKNYTVWDSEGNAHDTTEPEYRRNGEVNPKGSDSGLKKLLDSVQIKDLVPKPEELFVPQVDGLGAESSVRVIYLKAGDYKELVRSDSKGYSGEFTVEVSGSHGADMPIETVIFMEKDSTLGIYGGEMNVYIYGEGQVDVNGDTVIYGGIQAKNIYLGASCNLQINHGEPADLSLRTPSSAVGFKGWMPLDYNMEPSLED